MAARTLEDFDTFVGWKPATEETEPMRDILGSTKGRTKTQRDYGRDAGDYVPMLERRSYHTIPHSIPFGWDSSALATAQEARATDIRVRARAHCKSDLALHQLHNGCFFCVGYDE